MKAKSLSVFRTKLRQDDPGTVLVNIGDVIEGDDEHLRSLARNRLVELVEDCTDSSAKPAKAKAETKSNAAARPGAVAKPAKAKAVEGKTVSEPSAGKGDGIQMPPVDGSASLPPVQSAPKGGEGNS